MGAISQALLMYRSQAGGGGSEVDPTTIATCTEWVSADQPQWAGFSDGQAIGDATHKWEDRTGSGRWWEQSTPSARPTYRNVGGPNGKPFIEISSANSLLFSNTGSTLFDPDGWCMFVVVNPQENGNSNGSEFGRNLYTHGGYLGLCLFDAGGGTNKFRIYRYNGGYVGVNSQTTYSIGTWYIVEAWYDGTALNIRVNGDTTQSVTVSGYGSDANVGAIYATSKYAERMTFDSNISSGDRDSLRVSLATKYGITLP